MDSNGSSFTSNAVKCLKCAIICKNKLSTDHK